MCVWADLEWHDTRWGQEREHDQMAGNNNEPTSLPLWALGLWSCEVDSGRRVRLLCAGVLVLEREVEEPAELARLADGWREAVIAHHARLLDFILRD